MLARTPRTFRVALLGCGHVGRAVARRLSGVDRPDGLQLTHILDRRCALKRDALSLPASIVWTSAFDDILGSDVDVVVETVGGIEPATEWIREALLAGKSVVTANKQVIARSGLALWTLAARQGRQLRFEAAVGGAMPIVRAVADGLAGDRIIRIDAVLNGTTNAILSAMAARDCSLADALADAQAEGLAEADPSADLDGADASAKLAILCALAFGLRVDPAQIPTRSCSSIDRRDILSARARGAVVRQLAHAEFDRGTRTLTAWVAPTEVPRHSLFARIDGPCNAALVEGAHAGEIGIFGTGAGGDATAVAVISDLIAIARDRAAVVPPPRLSADFKVQDSNFRCERVSTSFSLVEVS